MKKYLISLLLVLVMVLTIGASVMAEEVTNLTFLTFVDPNDTSAPRSIAQKQLIDAFEARNPDIKVEPQVVGWAEVAPRLIRSVAAGNPPDVTRINSDALELQYGADTLMDLTPYIEASGHPEDYDNIIVHNGEVKAIWIDNRPVMLFYNKVHLAEIGLEEPPKTWDEIAEVAQQLSEKGHIGFAVGLNFNGSGNGLMEWLKPVMWALGGDLVDENGKAAFNGEAGVKAMQLLYDLTYKYNCITEEILSNDVDGNFQAFTSGRVSMFAFASHRFTTAQSLMGEDTIGIMPMPSFDGVDPAPAHVTGWAMAIPKGSAHPDEAWRFIDDTTSVEAMIVNAKVGGELPTREGAFSDPWFSEDPTGKEMMKWHQYIADYGRMPQFPEDYLELHEILCNAAQQIIFEQAPIQETLDEAAELYNEGK